MSPLDKSCHSDRGVRDERRNLDCSDTGQIPRLADSLGMTSAVETIRRAMVVLAAILSIFAPFAVSAGVCHFRCQGTPTTAPAVDGDSNISCSADNVGSTCSVNACNDYCRTRNTTTPTAVTYACAPGSLSASSCTNAPAAATPAPSPAPAPQQTTQATVERRPVFPVQLGVKIGSKESVGGINEYIASAYKYAVQIVLVAAIVMVIYGGFRYLVGSALEDVSRGKQIIKDAVIGMMIVLGAYLILHTINPATLRLSVPTISGVGQENVNSNTKSVSTRARKQVAPHPCTSTSEDCEFGLACIRGQCIYNPREGTPCNGGNECGESLVCSTATEHCTYQPPLCSGDLPLRCPIGSVCNAGVFQCMLTCRVTSDCPAGYMCTNGLCWGS